MEYPLTNWEVVPKEDFELAVPRDPGSLGVELMAQVRGNGWIKDHARLVVGGSLILERQLPVSMLINKAGMPA